MIFKEDNELRVGKRPVLELLEARGPVNRIVILRGEHDKLLLKIRAMAREQGVPVVEVEKAYFRRQAGEINHQGVLAWVAPRKYVEVEDLLEIAKAQKEPPCLLALDGLEDPQNLGNILRTVEGAGAHGIILPKRRSAQINVTVARTSAGAVDLVPVARVANLGQTLEKLKEQGCWVVGATLDASCIYYDADFTTGIVLVMGSEGKGLSRLIQEKCDMLVKIPMRGQLNSLNVSVATGILLYEILHQRLRNKS